MTLSGREGMIIKIMKRAITILLFMLVVGATPLHGQHFFGLRGGLGAGTSRFVPLRKTHVIYGIANGGVTWKYYGNQSDWGIRPYLSGIGAEALYFEQAYGHRIRVGGVDTDSVYMRRINSVMVPFMWQPHIYLAGERVLVFMNAGVTLNYNISSKDGYSHREGKAVVDRPYRLTSVRDNRMGYGLCGGLGVALNLGRTESFVEGRYYIGYSDVLKNDNKYAGNPLRSPVDNINISIGFYRRLGGRSLPVAPAPEIPAEVLERLFDSLRPAHWEEEESEFGLDPESDPDEAEDENDEVAEEGMSDVVL